MIEVYPEETTVMPPPGHGLNVPAELVFFNIGWKDQKTTEKKLHSWVGAMSNAKFVSYCWKTKEFRVRTVNF